MISPHRIKYNGIFSNELNMPDLITCVAFDSDSGDVETHLAREGVSSESYDGRYKRIHNFKYTDTFKCTITLTKSNFGDFTQEEVRTTLKWLTQKDTTALLEVFYDDSNVVSWASIGGFVNCSLRKLANNRTVAIVAEWDSIHPFCLSDIYTVTKTIASKDNTITINIDTDDNKPVYPKITVKHTGDPVIYVDKDKTYNYLSDMIPNTVYSNGTTCYWKTDSATPIRRSGKIKPEYGWTVITIDRNYTDEDNMAENTLYYNPNSQTYFWIDPYNFHTDSANNLPNLKTTGVKITNQHYDLFNQESKHVITVVKNNTTNEQIVIDGANQIISSTNTRRIFGDDFVNLTWLPLYDGKNELTVEGNCTVEISYRTVIKCGEY